MLRQTASYNTLKNGFWFKFISLLTLPAEPCFDFCDETPQLAAEATESEHEPTDSA